MQSQVSVKEASLIKWNIIVSALNEDLYCKRYSPWSFSEARVLEQNKHIDVTETVLYCQIWKYLKTKKK